VSTDKSEESETESGDNEPDAAETASDAETREDSDDAGEGQGDIEGSDEGSDSDEEADADEDSDEQADDDEEDDEDDEEDDEDDEATPAAKISTKGAKTHGGMTPGERLAAAKARKAKQKSDKRGRKAEVVEDRVLKKAAVATDWVAQNRQTLWIAVGAVVLVVAGVTYWSVTSSAKAEQASEALWDAVQAATGEIRSEGNIAGDQDAESEVFDSREARAEATLERAEKVRSDYPGTPAATWAALESGTALLDLSRWSDAREAFQAAVDQGGEDPAVTWRALEGIAFSYEGEEDWDQAIVHFNELEASADGAFEEIATYHIGRMHLAKGETEVATEMLVDLLNELREEDEERPDLQFVRSQTEIRLLELDSSLVPQDSTPSAFGIPGGGGAGGAAGGGGGLQDIPPEILQKLLQQQQQQGGAPE
jgi:predicted negative regulator of RcsB-dependent stress response